jgi:hypothetical protein
MIRKTLFVALLLASAAAAQADDSLYGRVTAKLTADPVLAKRLGKPAPELKPLAWMLGTWDVVAVVPSDSAARPDHGVSTVAPAMRETWLEIRDHYPSGVQDVGFLGYSPATKLWTSIGLDSTGNAVVTTGAGWQENTLTLSGDVTIVGIRTTLRQTLTRLSDRAYTLTNSERSADGVWRVLDTYRYTKK